MKIVRPLALSLLAVAALAAGATTASAQDPSFVVAVLPFEGADEGKSKDLQESMIEALAELGLYTLIEQKPINDALRRAGIRPGQPIPAAKALEIGGELEARFIATGTLAQEGGAWVATPSFVEVTTRNRQDLAPVRDRRVETVGTKVVESFNTRNQALKHLIFGRDYMRSENWTRAVSNFEQALQFDPQLASAHFYVGQVHLEQNQLDPALAALEKAIEINPAYVNAYHSIGTAYLEKGDTVQARSFFDQLVQRRGDDCRVQVAYGYVLANQLGDVEPALAAFERAKTLCPESPLPYQYLAYALPDDRRDEKIQNFQRYLDLSEGEATDPEALAYLFGLYFAEEMFTEAERTIQAAIAEDPSNASLQLYSGHVYEKLGKHQEAIAAYTRALEINPEIENGYLFRALAYQEAGDQAAARADLERGGVSVAPQNAALRFVNEAHVHLQRGRTGAALESINRAQQLGADGCAVAYYRGNAFYRMGMGIQGENASVGQNQRSIELFRNAIGHLRNACGQYEQYAGPMIRNANQYIERGEVLIRRAQGQAG